MSEKPDHIPARLHRIVRLIKYGIKCCRENGHKPGYVLVNSRLWNGLCESSNGGLGLDDIDGVVIRWKSSHKVGPKIVCIGGFSHSIDIRPPNRDSLRTYLKRHVREALQLVENPTRIVLDRIQWKAACQTVDDRMFGIPLEFEDTKKSRIESATHVPVGIFTGDTRQRVKQSFGSNVGRNIQHAPRRDISGKENDMSERKYGTHKLYSVTSRDEAGERHRRFVIAKDFKEATAAYRKADKAEPSTFECRESESYLVLAGKCDKNNADKVYEIGYHGLTDEGKRECYDDISVVACSMTEAVRKFDRAVKGAAVAVSCRVEREDVIVA